MIIKLFLQAVYQLFNLLTAAINIPALPEGISTVITTMCSYVSSGLAILAAYVDLPYLLVLFGIVVAVDAALWLYKIVMYFVHKIPMANIK